MLDQLTVVLSQALCMDVTLQGDPIAEYRHLKVFTLCRLNLNTMDSHVNLILIDNRVISTQNLE